MPKKTKPTKAADNTGAMIALYLPSDIGQRLALPGGEPVSELHLTLAFLGDMFEIENVERLKQFVAEFAATHYLQPARIGGIGRFNRINGDGNQAVYATVDSPNLPNFRQELVSGAEWAADVEPSRDYGFVPHVTLAYVPAEAPMPIQNIEPLEFSFKQISLTIGPERFDYNLVSEAGYINYMASSGMVKAGARHSTGDIKMLQDIHDKACALGAKCMDTSIVYPRPTSGKAMDLEKKLKDAGATLDEVLGIYTDRETSEKYYVNFGDWATDETREAVKKVLGDFESEAEAAPPENEWQQVWPQRGKATDPGDYKDEGMTPPDEKGKTTDNTLKGAPVPDGQPDASHQTGGIPPQPANPHNNALKAVSATDDKLIVTNRLALWHGRDLEGVVNSNKNADGSSGEFFTPQTNFESDYTAIGRLPVDWEHGKGVDGLSEDDILGYVDWSTAKADDQGLWVQRVLNRRNKYVQMLEHLINAGLIGTSSEAIPHQVAKKTTGEIVKWPLRRDTLTVSPMEPRMLQQNTLHALKALAQEVPAIKAACERMGLDLAEHERIKARLRLKAKQVQ